MTVITAAATSSRSLGERSITETGPSKAAATSSLAARTTAFSAVAATAGLMSAGVINGRAVSADARSARIDQSQIHRSSFRCPGARAACTRSASAKGCGRSRRRRPRQRLRQRRRLRPIGRRTVPARDHRPTPNASTRQVARRPRLPQRHGNVFFAACAPEGVGRPPSERTSKAIGRTSNRHAGGASEELSALTEADGRLPLEVAEALSILLEVDLACSH
jgi:hypothetical protein